MSPLRGQQGANLPSCRQKRTRLVLSNVCARAPSASRSGWLPILQTAVAAGLAWFLAVLILGLGAAHLRPDSGGYRAGAGGGRAPPACARDDPRGRLWGRDGPPPLLLSVVGVGAVQAGVVVVLAMGLAAFSAGASSAKEAAISAMIIMFTYTPSAAGFPIDRFLGALIGGGTALLINALLPANPERMVEDAAYPVFDESASVLEEVADALEDGDARLGPEGDTRWPGRSTRG